MLYVVWDDVGIAAWDAFGGQIDAPNMTRLATRGLRYSQWHTTGLSRPARYSLLTGRDTGMTRLGRPGPGELGWRSQSMTVPPEAGTLAEILAGSGYRSYCVGQWNLSPPAAALVPGSRRTWPLERGFDRFYGFLGAQTCQLYPDLIYDNQYVDPPYPPADGYHLNADLAVMAIEFIRSGAQTAQGKPWFCYLSFGPNNAPHAAPGTWTGKYRGRFETGYERYREIVNDKMKRLGLVPESTDPAPVMAGACGVRPWHSLSDEQKKCCAGLAEVHAGLCSYTDHQVGRLLDYLTESGQLDDTIVVVCSANASTGGSPDAPPGSSGISSCWPAYTWAWPRPGGLADPGRDIGWPGWAWALGTPGSGLGPHPAGGSAASPLIISWPREMTQVAGEVRDQYHHAVDVMPTILDCAAIPLPHVVNGHAQAPLDGVSMRHTFMKGDAAEHAA